MSLAQRRFNLLALALGLNSSLLGCGGSTLTPSTSSAGSTNAGAPSGAGAAPLLGGSGTSAGVGGKAGMPSAAGSGGSSGTSTSSAGGGGGAPGDSVCQLPWDRGECDAAFPRYWHNPVSRQCELRLYGGCGGNENLFDTYEICKFRCNALDAPNP